MTIHHIISKTCICQNANLAGKRKGQPGKKLITSRGQPPLQQDIIVYWRSQQIQWRREVQRFLSSSHSLELVEPPLLATQLRKHAHLTETELTQVRWQPDVQRQYNLKIGKPSTTASRKTQSHTTRSFQGLTICPAFIRSGTPAPAATTITNWNRASAQAKKKRIEFITIIE